MPGQTVETVESSRTIADLAARAAGMHGSRPAIRHRRDGEWVELSFTELGQIVEELALSFVGLGIEPGDRVCILANTRPEWTYASLAISSIGGVVVPIYPTNSPEECEWVAGNSEAKAIVCENSEQLAKIARVRASLPALEHTVVIDPDGGEGGALTLDELRERGRGESVDEVQRRSAAVTPQDPYTFIYTSGTTGPPKGCVISHANCVPLCTLPRDIGLVSDDDDAYLYLPLAHVFALTTQLGAMEMGSTIVYFGGDTRNIIGELGETHPTYLPSVPRIFEKLYAAATAQVEQATPEEREQFEKAVQIGLEVRRREARGDAVPEEMRKAFEKAEERIFRHVRDLFGGRIRYAVTGAAPIAPEILEFFYACGVTVLEGWGMTETTGAGCLNLPDALKFGTVGRPLPGFEIRTAEDGEIECRGALVFQGYWRNPEATKEVFIEDGWLRTGDLGEIDDEGFLKITGRKKDIIITAGGKNLTPANIENDLQQSRWISRAVMYGDRRPYPVALITLDAEEIVPWAEKEGLPGDIPSLAKDERVIALVQAELDRANERYARVEQVKKFKILDHDFSQEAGELTPTLKLKRNVVYDKYADVFGSMYDEKG
jgi:long-chain acyl-CoA synthetase